MEPHHDGSPLYLAGVQALGGVVTLRMRSETDDPIRAAWLRRTYDAEPVFSPAQRTEDGETAWWQVEMHLHSPVNNYRFLIEYVDGTQAWLTAAGLRTHDVSDTLDFKISTHPAAPGWTRRTVVYQVFPDRFARSDAADSRPTPAWAKPQAWDDLPSFEDTDDRTWLGFYGGDLDGIVDHLDHIRSLGADTLYLTPVFPGESNHRYNASTFDAIDPLLGGDEAYGRLADAVHGHGMQLLGDLTSNHTGDTHEWFVAARAGGETRNYYYFNADGSYECWGGYPTLPKLDHTNPAVRAAVIEVVQRWMEGPYALDGWRIDVANMTGRFGVIDINHQVAREIREAIGASKSDGWLIGEHNHDASGDIDGDGWHGTMNYSGFSWPVWSWLRAEDTSARAFGRPVQVPRRTGPQVVEALREWRARYGWRAAAQSWNILSSHDSARIRTMVGGDPRAHRVAAAMQFTLPGVPMVFAGDEIGLEGVVGEDGRRPMPWDSAATWDRVTMDWYSALADLRRSHSALIEGSLRWVEVTDDQISYLREHPEGTLKVTVNRTGAVSNPAPTPLLSTEGAQIVTVG
ncbi:MAG: glycoside hydrolase family 13 protein [Nocardioides sp.]